MTVERATPVVADLAALARAEVARQPAWSQASDDLNVNLLVIDGPGGVAAHVNDEVDVLFVGIAGTASIVVDETPHALAEGAALLVPKGARRAVEVARGRCAYLTCHRRRAGLWPRVGSRRGARPAPPTDHDAP